METETWVLEYSAESFKRGLYALHVQPLAKTQRMGKGPLGWRIIHRGSCEEVFAKMHEEHNKLYGED